MHGAKRAAERAAVGKLALLGMPTAPDPGRSGRVSCQSMLCSQSPADHASVPFVWTPEEDDRARAEPLAAHPEDSAACVAA